MTGTSLFFGRISTGECLIPVYRKSHIYLATFLYQPLWTY